DEAHGQAVGTGQGERRAVGRGPRPFPAAGSRSAHSGGGLGRPVRGDREAGCAGAVGRASRAAAASRRRTRHRGRRAGMKRVVVVAGLALLTAVGGGAWWRLSRPPENAPIVLTGNVEVRQVNLGFKVAGRIQRLKVDEGDAVTEGQSLAQLEKVYFEDS